MPLDWHPSHSGVSGVEEQEESSWFEDAFELSETELTDFPWYLPTEQGVLFQGWQHPMGIREPYEAG